MDPNFEFKWPLHGNFLRYHLGRVAIEKKKEQERKKKAGKREIPDKVSGVDLASTLGIQEALLSNLSSGKEKLLDHEPRLYQILVSPDLPPGSAGLFWETFKDAYQSIKALEHQSGTELSAGTPLIAKEYLRLNGFVREDGSPTASLLAWKSKKAFEDDTGNETLLASPSEGRPPPTAAATTSLNQRHAKGPGPSGLQALKVESETTGSRFVGFSRNSSIQEASLQLHEGLLRSHLKPWVKADLLEGLVDLSHAVVRRYNENPTTDVKQTILVEAQKAGFFEAQSDQSWFEAGLIAGLRPHNGNTQNARSNPEEYADVFEEEWHLDPELTEELLVKFENESFLNKKRDQLLAEGKRTRKTRRFLDILNVTLMQKAVVDDFMPIPIAINHMLACNSHEASQTLLKIVLCKHFLIAGRAQYAAPLMLELSDTRNLSQQGHFLDIRYNLLNASYPLRSVELYGSSDVSKNLQPSEFKSSLIPEIQPDWSNFDAYSLIIELCSKNGIDTGRFDTAYLQKLADEFGTTGPRMIYKFYCEELLRSPDKSVFADHLKTCITIMKNFSGVVRSDTYGKPFFTTPSWLPITLLNATCHNFGYTDLAEYVDETFTKFEGWSNQRLLMADVERMRQQGSFGTSIHLVNQARTLVSQNRQDEARDLLERYKNAFRHIRNMPTIAQNAAPLFEVLGMELKGIDRALVVGEPGGISYSNYIARCP